MFACDAPIVIMSNFAVQESLAEIFAACEDIELELRGIKKELELLEKIINGEKKIKAFRPLCEEWIRTSSSETSPEPGVTVSQDVEVEHEARYDA